MTDLSHYADANVLITGGMGMIGSTLAHQLVALGANVTLLDAWLEPYGANAANIAGIEDQVLNVKGDIRDADTVAKLVRGKRVIFNLAGQVSHNDSMTDPRLDRDINYNGHVTVLEACREHNPQVKILHAGSRLQYGRITTTPVKESHPTHPLTPYAQNKQAAEDYYLRRQSLDTVCVRIANPYGPRSQMKHSKYSMICWFIRCAMENKTITVFGDGAQVRDYLYVDDLSRALLAAGINEKATGNVYNVGSGVGTRFIDMAELVINAVGRGAIEQVDWPADYQNVETGDYVSDITAIGRDLSWRPTVSLEDGIERTVQYYASHGHKYFQLSCA